MNYFVDSPANYFTPQSSTHVNEFYPSAQKSLHQTSVPIQNQINPMTQMNVNYKQAQHYEMQHCEGAMEQQNDDLMLGNLPLFNQNYCEQMTDKLRHINMQRNGQATNGKYNVSRSKKHHLGLSHPLRLISQSDDSVNSLNFSRQCSGASTNSNTMVNPLTRQVESGASKNSDSCDPVDQILNIDDLLLKNDDMQDKCDSDRNLQSVYDTMPQEHAAFTSRSYTMKQPAKYEFQGIPQSLRFDNKSTFRELGKLPQLITQKSQATEASTNSVCSSEPEYKDSAKTCKSFLHNHSLPMLPEYEEESYEKQQCSSSSSEQTSKRVLRARELKVRQKIDLIKLSIKRVQTSQCGRRLLKLNQLRIELQREQKELKQNIKMQNENYNGRANEVMKQENPEIKSNSSVNFSNIEESVQFQDILMREMKQQDNLNDQYCPSMNTSNQIFSDNQQSDYRACSIAEKYELSESFNPQSLNESDTLSNQDNNDSQQNEDSFDDQDDSKLGPHKYKGRKTKQQMKILISYYHLYDGTWDEKNFCELIERTGFTKKQLNKWFWDRKKKETDALEAKKLSYPGLIFAITNVNTGKDMTPSFKKVCSSQPIFLIEKCKKE